MLVALVILALRAARIPITRIGGAARAHGWRILAALAMGLFVGGCTGSPRYRMMDADAQRAVARAPVEVKVQDAGVEFAVTALIVYDGAGAWKRDTYWDEYVVRITNHGSEPVVIETVTVRDVLDRSVKPGSDPWALDDAGRKHERFLQQRGAQADARRSAHLRQKMTAGQKAATGAALLVIVPAVVVFPPLALAPGAALLPAVPFILVGNAINDPKNRPVVEAEFNRRRLVLPVRIEPGASVAGSVFFPLAPGPEEISAHIEGGSRVAVPLPGLEELHFVKAPQKAALKAAVAKPRRATLFGGAPRKLPLRMPESYYDDRER